MQQLGNDLQEIETEVRQLKRLLPKKTDDNPDEEKYALSEGDEDAPERDNEGLKRTSLKKDQCKVGATEHGQQRRVVVVGKTYFNDVWLQRCV